MRSRTSEPGSPRLDGSISSTPSVPGSTAWPRSRSSASRSTSRRGAPTSAACCRSMCADQLRRRQGAPVRGAQRRRARRLHRAQRRGGARRLRAHPARHRARQPRRHGPRDHAPRARRPDPVRRQDPRQRARVRRAARSRRASCPMPARGSTAPPGCSSARATPPRAFGTPSRRPTCRPRPVWRRPGSTRRSSTRAATTTRPPRCTAIVAKLRATPTSEQTDAFWRDEQGAATALDRLELDGLDRHVAFVGKLLPAKGIDLLLAAWPLVLQREPRARLVVVGFGEFRAELERLLALLRGGNLDGARDLAYAPRPHVPRDVPRRPGAR